MNTSTKLTDRAVAALGELAEGLEIEIYIVAERREAARRALARAFDRSAEMLAAEERLTRLRRAYRRLGRALASAGLASTEKKKGGPESIRSR